MEFVCILVNGFIEGVPLKCVNVKLLPKPNPKFHIETCKSK